MIDLQRKLSDAIRHYWTTRSRQAERQGARTGHRDAGLRTAVTGGKHLDGFVNLCRDILVDAGLPDASIYCDARRELPGYYRAEKSWDLIVVARDQLLALIEFKAQAGPSFGNNLNNRVEEAIGNATDLWAAYREGAFKPSQRPWLGYVFILEECPESVSAVDVREPHFEVFPEFHGASYAKRYEIFVTKLLRDRLYDGTCLILTSQAGGLRGECRSPSEELSFRTFAAGLEGRARALANLI